MSTSTEQISTKLKAFMSAMASAQVDSKEIFDLYSAEVITGSAYAALGNGAAATKSTKLTKLESENASDISEQLDFFYSNLALTQGNYLTNMYGIIYGNNEATNALTVAIEQFGERSVVFCTTLIQLFNDAEAILSLYNDTDIAAATTALTANELPWDTFNKDDFEDAINLVDNFKKLLNNEVATQADYGATVTKWRKLL